MSGVVLRNLVGLRCAWCRPVLYPLSACSRSCTSLSPGPAVQAAPAATAAVQSPPTAPATTTASPSEWRAPTTPIRQSMFAGVHLDTHQMIKELQAAGRRCTTKFSDVIVMVLSSVRPFFSFTTVCAHTIMHTPCTTTQDLHLHSQKPWFPPWGLSLRQRWTE